MIEKTIPDFLTSAEILAQTGEEAAELAQAALKLRRADWREPYTQEHCRMP